METLTLIAGYIIAGFTALLAVVILWKISDGTIDLTDLISEESGGASMSRFQFLVFTFVIALSLFLVIISSGGPGKALTFPQIPGTVLSLLGISGSSYLVSKGIQFSDPDALRTRGTEVVITPLKVNVSPGATTKFSANVPTKPNSTVKWEIIAGLGTISADGMYTAPSKDECTKAAGSANHIHATIQVSSEAIPDAYDLAVVTILL